MSISPTDASRSVPSSSYRAISRNPSSNHGFLQESGESLDRQIGGAGSGALRSVQVSASESLGNVSIGSSGSMVAVAGGRFDPSKNVTGSRKPDAKERSYGQNSGTITQCQSIGRGVISPQFRSDQLRTAQTNGKPSGTANYLHSDHLAAGSGGLQGNSTQSAARRSQIVNGNHLLNFYYDPISRSQPRNIPRRQQKLKPYNKDLFLQANYKFVVLDTGGYLIESMDPDKMIQWDDVISVRYSTPLPVQCPICLESPLCPQITSCGHIYCFPCILRYLLMGEEDHKGDCWKKCPLCFMMISPKDLYTIRIDNVKQFHVGDCACFTLLTRPKESLAPLLKNQERAGLASYSSDDICDSFSKFILTSDVELSVREAKLELNTWLRKAESGLVEDLEKLPYVCAASEQLEERMKNWMENRNYSSSPPMRNHASPYVNLKVTHAPHKTQSHALSSVANASSGSADLVEPAVGALYTGPKHDTADSSEKIGVESSPAPLSVVPEYLESSDEVLYLNDVDRGFHNSSSCKDASEGDSYNFYQAIDGQHLILHPLNMKCLLHHYGTYNMLPPRISGEILELETVTQSEAMRRRFRFLSHFSLTTIFQLCEIDLSDILPPSSLAPFMDEIKKREKQRRRLAKKEEEERARAEAADSHVRPVLSDERHFSHRDAVFSLDDFEALGNSGTPSTSPPIISERKLFSNVTRLGFAAAHDSPSLKAEESAATSNTEETGEASSIQGPRNTANLSFANIISTPKTMGSSEDQKMSGSGKKGKKPTRVLMSTAGVRRY